MAELVTRVVDIPASRALGKDARTGARALANRGLQPHAPQAATLCLPGCNPMYLQARTSASTTASRLTSTRCAQTPTPSSNPSPSPAALALAPTLTLALPLTRRCAQTTGRWRTCSPTRRSTSQQAATPHAQAATLRAQPEAPRMPYYPGTSSRGCAPSGSWRAAPIWARSSS
jgi:hypothetical protein